MSWSATGELSGMPTTEADNLKLEVVELKQRILVLEYEADEIKRWLRNLQDALYAGLGSPLPMLTRPRYKQGDE